MKRLTFLFFFSQFFILGLFAEDITISSAAYCLSEKRE